MYRTYKFKYLSKVKPQELLLAVTDFSRAILQQQKGLAKMTKNLFYSLQLDRERIF